VRKQRDVFELARGKWSMEISLDEVNELGTFAEIELLVADGQQQLAKQLVIELQRELDLSEPIKSSYLSMLLAIKPEAATRPP
jgi:adenylate cyclase class IV